MATVSKNPGTEVLRRLYIEQGLGAPEIGRALGVCHTTVYSWLRAAGFATRPRGHHLPIQSKRVSASSFWWKGRATSAEEFSAELREKYVERRLSSPALAKEYGVSPHAVRYWLEQAGIPRRGKAEMSARRFRGRDRRPRSFGPLSEQHKANVSAALRELARTPERREFYVRHMVRMRELRDLRRAEKGLTPMRSVTECPICGESVASSYYGCCRKCGSYVKRHRDLDVAAAFVALRDLRRAVSAVQP